MDRDGFLEDLRATRNWGRWGPEDAGGTTNLIDNDKRLNAMGSVTSGQVISLAYSIDDWGVDPGASYQRELERRLVGEDDAGVLHERLTFDYHGRTMTHIDALCHLWSQGHMWNGKDPVTSVDDERGLSADVAAFGQGIVTRGVLLDIPGLRGTDHVTLDRPVEGDEFIAAAEREGIEVRPGDALVVYSGRDAYERQIGPWGLIDAPVGVDPGLPISWDRPGLEVSCVAPVRRWDVSLLLWDMMDARPNASGTPFTMHRVLAEHGLPLVDNVALGELARACAARQRWDFLLVVAPLRLVGSTGCPVNPIAIL